MVLDKAGVILPVSICENENSSDKLNKIDLCGRKILKTAVVKYTMKS